MTQGVIQHHKCQHVAQMTSNDAQMTSNVTKVETDRTTVSTVRCQPSRYRYVNLGEYQYEVV
jgi:hypothetical protein